MDRRADFQRRFIATRSEMKAQAMKFTRNPVEAEELIQMTALKAWRYYHRFDGTCFAAWFSTVMRNEFVSNFRRGARRTTMEAEYQRSSDDYDSARGEDQVLGIQLARLIAELPERQREIFCRRIIEQCSIHEIATEMKLPLGTVMTNVWRARQKLQLRLVA